MSLLLGMLQMNENNTDEMQDFPSKYLIAWNYSE